MKCVTKIGSALTVVDGTIVRRVEPPFVSRRGNGAGRGPLRAGPDRAPTLSDVSVHAGRGVGRSRGRRRRALDPARARAADRWRHAARGRRGRLGGGERRPHAEDRPQRHGDRTARVGALGARRSGRPAGEPAVLVSLPRRRRAEPDRPHENAAVGGRCRRSPPIRLRFLPALRDRATSPPTSTWRPRISTSSFTSATTSTKGRAGGPTDPMIRDSIVDPEAVTLDEYRSRYAQYRTRSRAAGRPCRVSVDGDLGRSRGREQLRRRDFESETCRSSSS